MIRKLKKQNRECMSSRLVAAVHRLDKMDVSKWVGSSSLPTSVIMWLLDGLAIEIEHKSFCERLSNDELSTVMSFLDLEGWSNATSVCKRWNRISHSPATLSKTNFVVRMYNRTQCLAQCRQLCFCNWIPSTLNRFPRLQEFSNFGQQVTLSVYRSIYRESLAIRSPIHVGTDCPKGDIYPHIQSLAISCNFDKPIGFRIADVFPDVTCLDLTIGTTDSPLAMQERIPPGLRTLKIQGRGPTRGIEKWFSHVTQLSLCFDSRSLKAAEAIASSKSLTRLQVEFAVGHDVKRMQFPPGLLHLVINVSGLGPEVFDFETCPRLRSLNFDDLDQYLECHTPSSTRLFPSLVEVYTRFRPFSLMKKLSNLNKYIQSISQESPALSLIVCRVDPWSFDEMRQSLETQFPDIDIDLTP